MEHRDTTTIIITSLLLLPWLGRTVAAAVEVWRGLRERQNDERKIQPAKNPRVRFTSALLTFVFLALAPTIQAVVYHLTEDT
jgi:hypothetical protein